MKRIISLILILVLCLSFAGCGTNTSVNEKYASLLNLLENGDFSAARQELDRLEAMHNGGQQQETTLSDPSLPVFTVPLIPLPTDSVPPVATVPDQTEVSWRDVEISTYDDFFDYFKPIQVLQVERNGFGEVVQVTLFTHFVLRDGLTIDGEHSQLAVEYGYSFCTYPLIEDPNTGEISLGDPVFGEYTTSDTATEDFQMGYCHNGEYTFHLYVAACCTDSPDDTSLHTVWPDGFSLLRLKGSIRIKGEPTDERFAEEMGEAKG